MHDITQFPALKNSLDIPWYAMRGFNAVFNHALAGHGIVNAALATTSAPVTPGVVPTAPGPSDVFKEGANCTFSWTPDASGQWKQFTVQLMSGNNFNMIPVTSEYPCTLISRRKDVMPAGR